MLHYFLVHDMLIQGLYIMLCSQAQLPSVPIQRCYHIINHMPYAVPFIPVNSLFDSWKPVPPPALPLFYPSSNALPSGNHQFVFCTVGPIRLCIC